MERRAQIEILVVEDEEAIRRGVCDVMAFHGHLPTGVATGDEGLRQGMDPRFELVILDGLRRLYRAARSAAAAPDPDAHGTRFRRGRAARLRLRQ